MYDIVNTFLNAARVRLNDAIDQLDPLSGQLLDNTQPFTQQLFNNAYRKLQNYLAMKGYPRLTTEVLFLNVPAIGSLDPSAFAWLDNTGYFDGGVFHAAPALPTTFLQPLEIWERVTGATDPNNPNVPAIFAEMDQVLNGLAPIQKEPWFVNWEWRENKLYFNGATQNTDLRIRFNEYLPDVDNDNTNQINWYEQVIPIERCLDALTDYICREVMVARGDADGAAAFQASAEANTMQIIQRDSERGTAMPKTSEEGRMRDARTPA